MAQSPRRDAFGTRTGEEGGEPQVGEKKQCKVVIKCADGRECTLPVEDCCGDDGDRTIVVRCDSDATDCCCNKDD
jgi:hypothetical protein